MKSPPSTRRKLEFIAKTIADLGKAIVAVGLASYLFEKFPMGWRVAFGVLSVVLIFAGILIYPEEGGEE